MVKTKPQVSSLGRFKSSIGVIFTPKPKKDGYISVCCNDKLHQIHQMMAIAFGLPKRDDQDTVDHINGNPSNNRLENLRWASRSEQVKHSYATNKNRGSSAQRTSKPVQGRKLGEEAWVPYASGQEANEVAVLEGEVWMDVVI